MLTFNDLPVYDIAVDDEFADAMLDFISLVSEPAIMMKGIAFNSNVELTKYKFDKDKMVIIGPVMVPDLPIFRRDSDLGEYYVRFQADRIEKLAHRFNRAPKEFKINVDHKTVVESAYIIENWIVEDKEFDKSRKYGFDVPIGTWMVAVKIDDEKFWSEQVKQNEKFGFSVEGAFGLEIINMSIEKQIKEQMSKIKEIKVDIDINNNEDLNKQEMSKTKLKFNEMKLADGTSVWVSAVEVGGSVSLFDASTLEKTPAPDGEHTLEDGTKIKTESGLITEIEAKEKEDETGAEAEVIVEAAVTEMDADAVLAIVQPKIDELYAVIAELKAMIEGKGVEVVTSDNVTEQAMSKAQLAMSVIKRMK